MPDEHNRQLPMQKVMPETLIAVKSAFFTLWPELAKT